MTRGTVWSLTRGGLIGIVAILAVASSARQALSQTMPGPVYHDLTLRGFESLADRISKKLELRADPDDEDVQSVLDRWGREEGGPDSGWDWIAVSRLWLRAGKAAEAETALLKAESSGEVPAPILLLDQARIAFLSRQVELAQEAYWKGCEEAGETAYREYWLDVEPLATTAELEDWDRFRRLPITQTDLCRFLRRFWNERALAAAMGVSERMSVHYARTRYALDNYRRRGGKKGPTFSNRLGRPTNSAFDDRGLLYVRMGPPDRTATFAGNPSIGQSAVSAECYQPNESWAYDYQDGTRVYHLSTLTGTDDYWLIENLGAVYRCGDPNATLGASSGSALTGVLSPVNENRFVALGPAASLVLQDLYRSRQGIDPRYARVAQHMDDQLSRNLASAGADNATGSGDQSLSYGTEALESQRILQQEREWTGADGAFAISTVPDRPPVAADTRVLVEELQFRGPRPGVNRVWLNGVVEAEMLTPTEAPKGTFNYRVDARWILVDELGEVQEFNSSFEAAAPQRLGRDQGLPVLMAADLPGGRYRYTLMVRDARQPAGKTLRSGNYRRADLTVRELSAGVPSLSDIVVAADSGGSWSPYAGLSLRPSPVHVTGADGVGFVYFEVYNLSPGGTYTTRVRLVPADGSEDDAFELSFPSDGATDLTRMSRRLLRLDLSNTEPGRYDMEFTVTDETTGASTLPYHTSVLVDRAGA